jgi:hypothetical protein
MIWEQGCTQYSLRQSLFDLFTPTEFTHIRCYHHIYGWLHCTTALQIFFFPWWLIIYWACDKLFLGNIFRLIYQKSVFLLSIFKLYQSVITSDVHISSVIVSSVKLIHSLKAQMLITANTKPRCITILLSPLYLLKIAITCYFYLFQRITPWINMV